MSAFLLEDFDIHIDNLRSQLQLLNDTLNATDHNTPDWVPADLVSLRNKTGRLQDDMKRFRDQLESEGLGEKKVSNKRLSLEGAKPAKTEHSSNVSVSPASNLSPHPPPNPPKPDDYEVQHIDVTEEVNRRLRESRLRRLMDSPSTSQKRKYDAFEDTRMAGSAEKDGGDTIRTPDRSPSGSPLPSKRLKASGAFEPVLKRKESGLARGDTDERNGEKADFKRRKIFSDPA